MCVFWDNWIFSYLFLYFSFCILPKLLLLNKNGKPSFQKKKKEFPLFFYFFIPFFGLRVKIGSSKFKLLLLLLLLWLILLLLLLVGGRRGINAAIAICSNLLNYYFKKSYQTKTRHENCCSCNCSCSSGCFLYFYTHTWRIEFVSCCLCCCGCCSCGCCSCCCCIASLLL